MASARGDRRGLEEKSRRVSALRSSPRPARLVAVGGLSGCRQVDPRRVLAPGTQARRRARASLRATVSCASACSALRPKTRLPPEAYRLNVSEQALWHSHCEGGKRAEPRPWRGRRRGVRSIPPTSPIAEVAASAGVRVPWPVAGARARSGWLRRVADRRDDASDATPDVVKDQPGRAPRRHRMAAASTTDGDMEAIRAAATRIIDDEILIGGTAKRGATGLAGTARSGSNRPVGPWWSS